MRLGCFQAVKEMSTVELERYKIMLNSEADQKMKVIAKEYDLLS